MAADKGANLFPVAKGVQVPFIGKDVKTDPISHLNIYGTEKHRIRMGNIQQSHDEDRTSLKQMKNPSRLKLKDKSKGKIDEKYLKLISSGLSFSDDVIDERVRDAKYSSNETHNVFNKLKKQKKKPTGLVGRHDTRCSVIKHYPCFMNNPIIHTAESVTDMKTRPLPKIKSKNQEGVVHEDNYVKSKISQTIPIIKPQISWDEYLMTLLSKETAEMVIKEHTSGAQQNKLNNCLDNANVEKLDKNLNKECQTNREEGDTEKQQRVQMEEKRETGNKICVVDRNNTTYSKEISKGAFPIHQSISRSNNIVLDSDPSNIYGKVLETSYPPAADNWYNWETRSKKSKKKSKGKVIKGMHKWKDYPELIEDNNVHKMTMSAVSPTHSYVELDSKTVKQQREDANLVRIVQEWRGKWFLEKKWENSSNEELLAGMSDINDHVRLSAVSACSKALLNKKIMETKAKAKNILLANDNSESDTDVSVSTNIFEKIVELLSDRCSQVQVASAITLFALNRANQKAKEILLETLTSGGPPEKWAAAQCLSYSGCDADMVVNELISNINSTDLVKHSKAVKLLGRLSKQSNTVQYTLAEQLNSSSWRDRVVACQVFPSLQGPLSKDTANKISHLMWNDWSKDVRTAAARALGRTGNGKLVHDKLRERLINGNEIEKLDALRKISFLGIMTGRLLPAFLDCLKSDYISIRLEAVMTVSAIRLAHEETVTELLKLATEERNWKVKAHCIKAIGLVAKPTENVQEILLWCLRYEREAALRAEACRAIRNLKLNSQRVVDILQDRMVVEEDTMVQREVAYTLNQFGLEPTGDLTMIKAIQKEVKRLCNRDDIAVAIVNQDVEERFEENRQKFLTYDDEDDDDGKNDSVETRRSSQANAGVKESRFDPILEGYKIRSQSKIPIPSLPEVPNSVLDFDVKSNSGESFDAESDMDGMDGLDASVNYDNQTATSYSTSTLF